MEPKSLPVEPVSRRSPGGSEDPGKETTALGRLKDSITVLNAVITLSLVVVSGVSGFVLSRAQIQASVSKLDSQMEALSKRFESDLPMRDAAERSTFLVQRNLLALLEIELKKLEEQFGRWNAPVYKVVTAASLEVPPGRPPEVLMMWDVRSKDERIAVRQGSRNEDRGFSMQGLGSIAYDPSFRTVSNEAVLLRTIQLLDCVQDFNIGVLRTYPVGMASQFVANVGRPECQEFVPEAAANAAIEAMTANANSIRAILRDLPAAVQAERARVERFLERNGGHS